MTRGTTTTNPLTLFAKYAATNAPWTGSRVTRARTWLATQTTWPTPCPRCHQPVHPTHWHLGHTIDRNDRPDLTWNPGNWRIEHPRCNTKAGAIKGNIQRGKLKNAKQKQNGTAPFFPGKASVNPAANHSLAPSDGKSPKVVSDIGTPFTKTPRTRPDNAALPLMFSGPHPEAVGSYGDMAVVWIEARMAADPNAEGDDLLWHQWLILQRSLEHRADGSLCWPLVLCEAPRQQGKTVLIPELALWRSGHPELFGEMQRVLHAARVASLADQVQGRAHLWAEGHGLKVSRRKADSYITWPDGSYWHVMALAAVWGQRVGLAMLDEGWDMSPAQFWSGLWPAMAQRRMRQAWVFSASNVGDRGLLASLRRLAQTLIMFWGAPAGADVTDEAVWHAATPFMTPDRLEAMRIAVQAPGFGVEWLNIAPEGDGDTEGWGERLVELLPAPSEPVWSGQVVLGVESERDGSSWGVAASDGAHVLVVSVPHRSDALAWLRARFGSAAELCCHESVARQLGEDLEVEVVPVPVVSARAATAVFREAVEGGRLSWSGVLREQLAGAVVAGGTGLEFIDAAGSSGPVAGVKAGAWAYWRASTSAMVEPAIW